MKYQKKDFFKDSFRPNTRKGRDLILFFYVQRVGVLALMYYTKDPEMCWKVAAKKRKKINS